MISGYFDPRFNWPAPKVRAALYLPDFTANWVSVDFLLDTGASTTCLHPLDAVARVGIDPVRLALPQYWAQREQRFGVGGTAVYYPVSIVYAFLHHDNRWQTIQGQIRIAQLRSGNQSLDSLLGWDVLQQFQIAIDWPTRLVTLQ